MELSSGARTDEMGQFLAAVANSGAPLTYVAPGAYAAGCTVNYCYGEQMQQQMQPRQMQQTPQQQYITSGMAPGPGAAMQQQQQGHPMLGGGHAQPQCQPAYYPNRT